MMTLLPEEDTSIVKKARTSNARIHERNETSQPASPPGKASQKQCWDEHLFCTVPGEPGWKPIKALQPNSENQIKTEVYPLILRNILFSKFEIKNAFSGKCAFCEEGNENILP
jgi:hypothetical protein